MELKVASFHLNNANENVSRDLLDQNVFSLTKTKVAMYDQNLQHNFNKKSTTQFKFYHAFNMQENLRNLSHDK